MKIAKTIIIGGVPQPVGGVTGYIYRFCHHLPDYVNAVIDLYPSPKKWSIGNVTLIHNKGGKINTLAWLISSILKVMTSRQIYFNFSSTKFLKVAALTPKLPWQTWILTLHHGELETSNGLGVFEKIGLKRMNRIGHIGSKQRKFYLDYKCEESKLHPVVPFLPYVTPPADAKSFDVAFSKSLNNIRQKHKKILVASGYPTSIYNHEWILDYMADYESTDDVALVLCLYGSDSENRWDILKDIAEANSNVYLFEHLQPDAFQEVLQIADIYLRPNDADSYGVAVGEAISLGKIAIASDACDRFPGAQIFHVGDKQVFYSLVDKAIKGEINNSQLNLSSSLEMCKTLMK